VAAAVGIVIALSHSGSSTTTSTPVPGGLGSLGGGGGGGSAVETQGLHVPVPAGFTVTKQDAGEVRLEGNGGFVIIGSTAVQAGTTMEQVKQSILSEAKAQAPDARVCSDIQNTKLNNGGVQAQVFIVCGTVNTNGRPTPTVNMNIVGLSGGNQPILCAIQNFTADSNLEAFVQKANPIQSGTVFKQAPRG
jgi:hypothetical protein